MTVRGENQLVYLSFGADTYHMEAFFSVVSAISRTQKEGKSDFDINVYTDNPAFYSRLPVNVYPIEKEWFGPFGYVFRAKHVVLLACMASYDKSCLIDTDTFFKRSPSLLFGKVKERATLCNAINESPTRYLDDKLKGILIENGVYQDRFLHMNSGVIGLCKSSKEVLERSVQIIDTLHPELKHLYTLEEVALSVASSVMRFESDTCENIIHHYWSKKEIFRRKVNAWYDKHHAAPLTLSALADARKVTPALPKPPPLSRVVKKLASLFVAPAYRKFYTYLTRANHMYANEFDRVASKVWLEQAFKLLEADNLGLSVIDSNKLLSTGLTGREMKKAGSLGDKEYQKLVTSLLEKDACARAESERA